MNKYDEAVKILQETIIFWGRMNGKTCYIEAQKLAIKALRNEQKREELIEYYQKSLKQAKEKNDKRWIDFYIAMLAALTKCEVE